MPFSFKYIKSKRWTIFFISLFFVCIFALLFFLPKPKMTFQEMTGRLFIEDLTTDTLSLHYTLAYPSHYSIDSYPLTLPEYDEDNIKQSYSQIENILSAFSKLDSSALSFEESYCYDLLYDYFTMQKKGFPFTYFEEFFSPSSGIPANFPILMAEYSFRTKQDITDYLTLLTDTPNYFSTFFDFQQERAKKGYYLASASLQKTIEQCDTILTKEALEKNSHFLQLTFRERILPLVAQKFISKKEAAAYIKENNDLLKNVVLPAYQKLKTSLLTLQTNASNLEGLYKKEQGKNYYEWLVQKQVGCTLTIPEIIEKLENDYNKNLKEFLSLQMQLQKLTKQKDYDLDTFPLSDRNEILKTLQTCIREDFPSLSEYSDRPIKTTIKSVSECMEEFSSPAFYLIPPIDDIWKNTIYINNDSTPEGLDLFTTLAHEGYPGHLYQTVFFQLYTRENQIPLIRHLMNYGGYVEGWAIYSEFLSYDYATTLYPKEDRDFYSLWHKLLLTDRKLQLGILSILDIKLHYYDDSYETAKELLNQYGIVSEESITETRRYILEEPGNYLKYYMGYLLLADLKEKARTLMGSDFTDKKFHEFILNSGPSDFDSLEKRLLKVLSSENTLSFTPLPPA